MDPGKRMELIFKIAIGNTYKSTSFKYLILLSPKLK